MKVALLDNGSLEPASHLGLRSAARALSARSGADVTPVSWKHSDRIAAADLDGISAYALAPWIRAQRSAGEGEFLFVPFFISPQGAIGSALRRDLARLQEETGGFEFEFSAGLSEGAVLSRIVAERVLDTRSSLALGTPTVIVVDHGGPSPESAQIRDRVASEARELLGKRIGALAAASMEARSGHALPLLSELLGSGSFASGDVIIAPLFLLPGRHAGPGGDLAAIARGAESTSPGLRCHMAGLVGNHPGAIDSLSASLERALAAPANA